MTPSLLAELAALGLDLAATFDAAHYDELLHDAPALAPLERLAGGRRQAWVIGNTRALWPHVRRWAAEQHRDHPVDTYVSATVNDLLAKHGLAPSVHFDTDAGERRVDMCRAAAAAGLADRGPAHLVAHPVYGPWFALRAVLVFDGPPPARAHSPGVCHLCAAPCADALAAALEQPAPTNSTELAARWRVWVAVRDACPVGREHRYSEQQLRYHYTKDLAALDEAEAAHGVS